MYYYKLMWVPNTKEIVWDMKKEIQVPCDHSIYKALSQYIDLGKWIETYKLEYEKWLKLDQQFLFDLNYSINSIMINVIKNLNQQSKEVKLFYWYDVNRDLYPDFKWKNCPISKKKLKVLNETYHSNNRFLCLEHALVMPSSS